MDSEPLTLGIAGTGFITKSSHVPAIAKSSKIFIKGLYDVQEAAAKDTLELYKQLLVKSKNPLSERVSEIQVHESFDSLLDTVDAVDIATPPKYHVEALKVAFAKKKHVICEKPLARNWWEAEQLARETDAAKKAGLAFQLHTQAIWNPLIEAGRDLLQQGVIGEIEKIRTLHQGSDPKHTVNLPALWDKHHGGGGALIDIGPHAYASMWYWLGGAVEPVDVTAVLLEPTVPVRTIAGEKGRKVSVDDDAHISITWKGPGGKEITGELEATWNKKDWFDGKVGTPLAPDLYYEVHGSKGVLSFPHVVFSLSSPFGLAAAQKVVLKDGSKKLYKQQLPKKGVEDVVFFDEFADVAAGKVKPRNDIGFAMDMLAAFGAAYLSKKKGGEPVTIDEFKAKAKEIGSKAGTVEEGVVAIIDDLFAGFTE